MESNVSCTFAGRNEDWAEIDKSPAAAAANNGNGGGGGIPRAGLGIAERRAAKSGFSLGSTRLNTARIRTWTGIGTGSDSPPVTQHSPPTCFTISPGISPTALLDSPVMLPNSQGQISPTTGTFSVASFADDASVVHSAIPTKDDGDEGVPGSFTFSFNQARYPSSNSVFLAMEPYQGTVVERNGFSVQDPFMQVDFLPDIPTQDGGEKNFTVDLPSGIENLSNMSLKTEYRDSLPCSSDGSSSQTIPKSEANDREENPDFENAAGGGDNKETYSSLPGMSRNSEDGYNWRKYGQKQVKGSEFPRSYYKCTHPSCPVKKNVERSLDGQIAEIIYKGAHNHPKPQPARHGMIPTAFSLNKMPEMSEGAETFIKVGSESQIWRNDLIGSRDIGPPGSEWRNIGLERTPSISLMTDLSDTAATTVQGKSIGVFDPVKTPELSSAMASHNDGDEDGATQGSFSPGEDADDDELESKRRRSENCFVEASLSTRAVREPRVVIQIESEIDILDDGYRWRKYGQKVVKGNPNPRSYYKCTSTGCPVRKHVERASNDLKCIVTTYEGKHIHEVPVARNGCHVPSSSGNLGPSSATGQTYLSMPRNSVMPKQETQAHAIALMDRKPEFANEFLRSSLLVNFGNDMRCGTTSLFPVKYPPLQNSVPCGPYRLIPSQSAVHAPGSIAALVPEFPISMPFKYQQLRNVPMNGLEIHHHSGKAATAFSYHPSIPGQCVKEEVKYLAPKQERDDGLFQACIPVMDPPSASPSSMLWPLVGGYPT